MVVEFDGDSFCNSNIIKKMIETRTQRGLVGNLVYGNFADNDMTCWSMLPCRTSLPKCLW